MTTLAYDQSLVEDFRRQLKLVDVTVSKTTGWEVLRHVLEHGGDEDIAITAMLMAPRPAWLTRIIG